MKNDKKEQVAFNANIGSKIDYLIESHRELKKDLKDHLDKSETVTILHTKELSRLDTALKYTWKVGGVIVATLTIVATYFGAVR